MARAFADWCTVHDAAALETQCESSHAAQQHDAELLALDAELCAANEAAVAQWLHAKAQQAEAAEQRWRQVHATQRPGPGTAGNFVTGCQQRRQRRRVAAERPGGAYLAESSAPEASALPPLHRQSASRGDALPTSRVSALRRRHRAELRRDAVQQAAVHTARRERTWDCLPIIVHKPNSYLFSVPARAKQGGVLAAGLFDLEPGQRPAAHAMY